MSKDPICKLKQGIHLKNNKFSLVIYSGYKGSDIAEKTHTPVSGLCKFVLQ